MLDLGDFFHALRPLFNVVPWKKIKSDILKEYNTQKEKTMRLLERNCSRIAITADMEGMSKEDIYGDHFTLHWWFMDFEESNYYKKKLYLLNSSLSMFVAGNICIFHYFV